MPENDLGLTYSFARPELAALTPVVHGGLDFGELERLGLSSEKVIDFSANINPFGPAPSVRAALVHIPLDRYPDRDSLALRYALAATLNLDPSCVMLGNGVAELIHLIALAFLQPGDSVLILTPTFSEYARAAHIMGANIHTYTATSKTGFAFDEQAIAAELREHPHKLVFICNPNNPTGQCLPSTVFADWAMTFPQTLFVIDEAYLAFAQGIQTAITSRADNILVLRSMTKDYALAGLRLGYAIGCTDVINALVSVRPPWNVNALAQVAGLAALQDESYIQRTLAQLALEKTFLFDHLKQMGCIPVPSRTHFFLLPVGNGATFRCASLAHGILLRDCRSFGLPEYVRIAPRQRAENLRLLQVFQEIDQPGFMKDQLIHEVNE